MDKYKLKFTKLQNEIFRLLSIKTGEKMSQRQIAKLLEVSPTAISKSLPLLEKEQLIKIEKDKIIKVSYISLNRDSEKATYNKRIENLKLIYDSEIINHLEEKLPGSTIILFGSYSNGEDTTTSDIDIAIIGRKPKQVNLEKFEKFLEREININFYDSLNEIHENLKNNILGGILLVGYISK